MDVAASLRLEGSGTARGALRELRRLHEGASPDLDGLHRAGHTLVTSLSLIQRLLAERFSCDAREVFRRAAAYRATRGLDPARISWDGTDEALARGFPLLTEDCFTCLDELLANAAKKEPLPGRILVGVHPRGPRGATLRVWDDGVALEAEGARAARAGDRSGLARLGELLAPYGGKVVVEDAPGGGVNAEVRLPRFDLD
mgnify:FL=1